MPQRTPAQRTPDRPPLGKRAMRNEAGALSPNPGGHFELIRGDTSEPRARRIATRGITGKEHRSTRDSDPAKLDSTTARRSLRDGRLSARVMLPARGIPGKRSTMPARHRPRYDPGPSMSCGSSDYLAGRGGALKGNIIIVVEGRCRLCRSRLRPARGEPTLEPNKSSKKQT
jgi:hypothetical protein